MNVFDASALLAFVANEAGAEVVETALAGRAALQRSELVGGRAEGAGGQP